MIAGSVLGGTLARVTPGLPFLAAGLVNLLSIVAAGMFFARVAAAETSAAGVAAQELGPVG